MKIRLALKDPDGIFDSIMDAAGDVEDTAEEYKDALRPWLKWGECIEMIVDTETGTAQLTKVHQPY